MIPPNAINVFSGVLFDVYQWPQKMFVGTTATFEMLKRADTAEILAIRERKIMLQEQEQPNKSTFYCFPGGRIEKGEEPIEGAKRELLEESGCVSDVWNLWQTTQPLHKMDWKIYVYFARDCREMQAPNLDPGERIKTLWVTLDELLDFVDAGKLSWIDQNLRVTLIRAKYHKPSREELNRIFFPL